MSQATGPSDGDAARGRSGPARGESAGVGAVIRRELKAAVARWALHKQRRTPDDESRWRARDEATHDWDGRKRFGEDYTFAAVQRELGLLVRLEWLPGRNMNRVWLMVLRPDGVWMPPGGQFMVRGPDKARWRAAGLELDCVEPMERWTIRYTGRLTHSETGESSRASLDLTFVAAGSPFSPGIDDDPDLMARRIGEAEWDRQLLSAVRRDQNQGYVQVGDLIGTAANGLRLFPLRAAAWRQHMWGVRDWGGPDRAFQCFLAWDAGGRGWVHHARFPFVTFEGGFVRDLQGERAAVSSIGATEERREGRTPANASLTLGAGATQTRAHVATESDASFVVDGRGRIAVGLCKIGGPDGGWALWAGQSRTLPRPSGARPRGSSR